MVPFDKLERKVTCPYCKFEFDKLDFSDYKGICSGVYKCPKCSKDFNTNSPIFRNLARKEEKK